MKTNITQQQSLQQRIVPLQIQIGKMLEMTGPEIEDEVRHKLEELPALESADNDDSYLDGADDTPVGGDLDDVSDRSDSYDDTDDYSRLDVTDRRNRSVNDTYRDPIAVADEESLAEHLHNQLSELNLSPLVSIAADAIIGNLDSRGYLTRSLDAIAVDLIMETGMEIPAEVMHEAFESVRTLDPAGVGAIDLRDTLILQLSRLVGEGSPEIRLAYDIVDSHFELLTKKHHDKMAKRLGVDNETLKRALEIISHLNPKPGNQFGDSALERTGRLVNPEFRVEPDGNNLEVTILNKLPHLVISQSFREDATPAASRISKAESTYIKTHRNEALDFIRALEKRQQTLFGVMSAIALIQRDFFMTGNEAKLKPMGLKDIEKITGDDLSVISRVTSSKYVMTVAGVYPLKFFFNERVARDEDDDTTFPRIAAALREIVDHEDKKSPLSDETITARLAEKGFNVARRTVAKYRERLGYPVARLRKKL